MNPMQLSAIINVATLVANKLKCYLYEEEPWTPGLAFKIGYELAKLKKITRKFYPHCDEVQFLHELSAYTKQDVCDAFEMDNPTIKDDRCLNQPSGIGSVIAHSMAKAS